MYSYIKSIHGDVPEIQRWWRSSVFQFVVFQYTTREDEIFFFRVAVVHLSYYDERSVAAADILRVI